MNPDDLKTKRLAELEVEFLARFPEAHDAAVYEFDTPAEADEAKATLLATALVAGRAARVVRVTWQQRSRLVALGT